MNVYLKPGTATAFSQSGAGNSATTLVPSFGSNVALQVEATSTKPTKGGRRVWLKATIPVPEVISLISGGYTVESQSRVSDMTANVTFNVPDSMLKALSSTNTDVAGFANQTLAYLVNTMIAVISGDTSRIASGETGLSSTAPIYRGCFGQWPLDLSGNYGKATA